MKWIFLFSTCFFLSCSNDLYRADSKQLSEPADYIIEMKAYSFTTSISDVLNSLSQKVVISVAKRSDAVFINEEEIHVRCNGISLMDLNLLISELMKCPGIVEINQHKITNSNE